MILTNFFHLFEDAARNWDMVKLTLSTFAGAGTAIWVARHNDSRKLHRENVAAGNLALLALRDQINDFLVFRKRFRHDVANPARGSVAPVYMLVQPMFFQYAESAVDFASLSFLMEQRNHIPKLNSLVFSTKLYRNLMKLDTFRNETIREMQEKLAEVEHTNPARTAKEIERVVGPFLISTATYVVVGLALHARDDENVYRQAVKELREALLDTLGPWWWPDRLRKRWPKLVGPALIDFTDGDPDVQEDALPALPKQLLSAMEAQENGEVTTPSTNMPSWYGSASNYSQLTVHYILAKR
ncbi:hypothetical protein [Massilia sp. erpn]|uniref:hypothetical protein n=1 Tax=Massilia sp. erpn TaxID=2738142 RepID=UPI0021077D2C|nr:hypothetical protein [Massilia sp. erpn]UTY59809.1 hypothetical protein HPQ68_23075 [Massilia sp. erpn]